MPFEPGTGPGRHRPGQSCSVPVPNRRLDDPCDPPRACAIQYAKVSIAVSTLRVPSGTVSHAARYLTRQGIPRGTASHAARYPTLPKRANVTGSVRTLPEVSERYRKCPNVTGSFRAFRKFPSVSGRFRAACAVRPTARDSLRCLLRDVRAVIESVAETSEPETLAQMCAQSVGQSRRRCARWLAQQRRRRRRRRRSGDSAGERRGRCGAATRGRPFLPHVCVGTAPASAPGTTPISAAGPRPHRRRDCTRIGAETAPTSAPRLRPHLHRDCTAPSALGLRDRCGRTPTAEEHPWCPPAVPLEYPLCTL